MPHDTSLSSERWLPVVGYEGYYEVSDHGRVKSLDRTDSIGRKIKGRMMKTSFDPGGRVVVDLYRDGTRNMSRVHRLVTATFIGPCPSGREVCHNDGDQTNNHVSNLRYDTSSGNEMDKIRHGTHHWARKTHCPKGHPLEAPNLVPSGMRNGGRSCLACSRARSHTWRHPDLKAFFQELSDSYYEKIKGEG